MDRPLGIFIARLPALLLALPLFGGCDFETAAPPRVAVIEAPQARPLPGRLERTREPRLLARNDAAPAYFKVVDVLPRAAGLSELTRQMITAGVTAAPKRLRVSLRDRLQELQDSADSDSTAQDVTTGPTVEPPVLELPDGDVGVTPVTRPRDQVPTTTQTAPSPLPWSVEPVRSPAMEAVTRQADECTRRGYELAGRGAVFSARSEFVRSLRIVAQALDAQHQTNVHGKALAAGLRAIVEADDFVPRNGRIEAELNVPLLISSHQTPVLKDVAGKVTPLAARQRYYTFAQEQLGAAGGRERAASVALYALGKIQTSLVRSPDEVESPGAKAIVFHRAALAVDSKNFMAANDLGTLLAQFGRWEEAREALVQSLNASQQSVTWRNLAVVHRQLGEAELAGRAGQESKALASLEQKGPAGTASSRFDVKWMEPDAFAESTSNSAQVDVVQAPSAKASAAPSRR